MLGDKTNLSTGTGVSTPFPYMYVNHSEYCIPIFRMGSSQQTIIMRDYSGSAATNNPKLPGTTVTVTGPASAVRPSGPQTTGADGHLVLYNPTTRVEYDFWQATTSRDASGNSLGGGQVGGTIYAEDIKTANLNLTTAEVNTLAGQAAGTPIPDGKTKWQVVLEKLNSDLESIPFASSIWKTGDPAATATASAYNFEVVDSPARP